METSCASAWESDELPMNTGDTDSLCSALGTVRPNETCVDIPQYYLFNRIPTLTFYHAPTLPCSATLSIYHTLTLPYSATLPRCHTLPLSHAAILYHSLTLPYCVTCCHSNTHPLVLPHPTILGSRSQSSYWNCLVPPNIVDSQSSGDMMVQEGANINLTCSATGTPMPSITWRREDHEPITINKTLRVTEYNGANLPLTKISRVDMAAYLCIARNGVPPIVSKRIQVSVDFPPMMSIPHQLVGAPLGYSITLECTIEAHPPALTYWTRGQDVMLHPSRKYSIEERFGKVSYCTHMKLTIRSLKAEDFGSYKCVAKNSRGETEGLIKLYGI
ncbi:lachesin-like [Penaeus indicus]|uniref:lachesin-like n=1 Tax=Penaeus indicus TaxID=29960 RepID=UPI00300DAB20